MPARVKEWAYAGFAITLVSALIAHLAVGDTVKAWGWSVGTAVLWGPSYFFFRRLPAGKTANYSIGVARASGGCTSQAHIAR